MRSATVVAASVIAFHAPVALGYSLVDDYMSNDYADFFNKFNFWTTEDTTGGFVDYVSQSDAWNMGLIGNGGNIYMGVDDKTYNTGNGRASTRLTSTKSYNSTTLFVADISHMVSMRYSKGSLGRLTAFFSQVEYVARGQPFGPLQRLLLGLKKAK